MTRLEALAELHLAKSLKKAEDNLRKHEQGIWASAPEFVDRARNSVQRWARWRDTIASLIQEEATDEEKEKRGDEMRSPVPSGDTATTDSEVRSVLLGACEVRHDEGGG